MGNTDPAAHFHFDLLTEKIAMKLLKMMLLFLALSISLFAFFVFSMDKLEVTSSSYDNYAEVAAISNIFETGWIPPWLPESATKIRESHDIDTNESWLMFSFHESDKFYLSCSPIPRNKVDFPLKERVGRFPGFVANNFEKLRNGEALIFYFCDDTGKKFLAIDKKEHVAYMWGVPH